MSSTPVRFGRFEFSPESGELLREGVRVRLQPQPGKVLASLVRRSGAVVTREELQREVWSDDVHVDFERGLNFCIAQIRTALGDSADGARYIETVPKQGYRFVAPVTSDTTASAPAAPASSRIGSVAWRFVAGGAFLFLLIIAAITLVKGRVGPPTVVVIPFYNETGNPASSPTAASLGDVLVAKLAAPERRRQVAVIGNAPSLRNPFARRDVQEMSRQLGAAYLVIGQLKTDGARLRLVAHLIRVDDMKHLWANTYDDERFTLDAQTRAADEIASAVATSLIAAK